MFEARLLHGSIFAKVIEGLRELVNEATWECSGNGITLQAMDSSHVALVSLVMRSEGFESYRCDRNMSLGISLVSMSKVLKTMGKDDSLTIRVNDDSDSIIIAMESQNQDKFADYELRLMDLDSEHLGIPDTDYSCTIKMPSSEFSRICRDMSIMGDSVLVCTTKEGVKFSAKGDLGQGSIRLVQTTNIEKEEEAVVIEMKEAVALTFAVRYLSMFCKAAPLSPQVGLSLSEDTPLMCEFKIAEMGHAIVNNIADKPIKVNKWESNAVKNALDDACKKYFKETLNFTEDYKLMDGRLYISFIACLFSGYALVYDWLNPFPKSRSVLILCVIAYFILMGILTFYMQFIERSKFYTGKLVDRTGLDPVSRCTVSSKLKKYDDKYNLTLEYNDGKDKTTKSTQTLLTSVGNYFDENGVLIYDRLTDDLKKLYDQARSNARKVK
ncbi:unnamed protein product [Adineta steineri]|uniref:DNA sliding clamp PCNA n=1 Tax=Adineta steineri TaxID=433720 RepID=A0A819BQ24_9BILA|nr:unnamed protein product [Adineta steineri]CAF1015163.1 unnamed protein product [Adineta steineri]CAF3807276.1 unnamed protein product [Adineta steineri]CAF3900156.1 unnamed protein product [Adineta steineri]